MMMPGGHFELKSHHAPAAREARTAGSAGQPIAAGEPELLAERRTVDARAHGELLAPHVEAALAHAGARPRDHYSDAPWRPPWEQWQESLAGANQSRSGGDEQGEGSRNQRRRKVMRTYSPRRLTHDAALALATL